MCAVRFAPLCDAGGASTQIIFRHDGSGRDSAGLQAGHAAAEPAAAATIKDSDGHCCDNTTNDGSSRASRAGLTARDVGDAGGEDCEDGDDGSTFARFREQEREGGVSSVPVSQSDFWGASHLGYGVGEVSL